jgi:hypothetical protein
MFALSIEEIFNVKRIIQKIYNNNYRFDSTYTSIEAKHLSVPSNYLLYQNYPNPFNPTTIINYSVPETEFVTLKVYDVLGNETATLVKEEKAAGNYEVSFSATNLPSGIYFYRLQAGDFLDIKKMVLLR